MDDRLDVRGDKMVDDEEWDGSDKRKHRSSRSRKSGSVEDAEGLDVGGSRRSSSGNRSESRKRSAGGSGRGGSDEDDHETRKESRSKQMKKKQEESSLEKLSSWYQDGEFESRQGGDKYAGKGHGRVDESEKRKLSSKISEHESFHSGSKTKEEKSFDGEYEKTLDRDSAYSERRESSREKGQGSVDVGRSSRRRWDVCEEYHHEKASDRALDSSSDKGIKTNYRDERRSDSERAKGKSRSEVADADNRYSPTKDRSGREKGDKYRQHRTPSGRDVAENREMSSNVGEDGWTRDKNTREVSRSNRSRTPEKSGKHPQESQHPDEYDRSSDMRRKDVEKDGYRDDRSKGRDESWGDRNRERESSKENWRRRDFGNEKESKDGDTVYDRGRDWGPRHGRERNDNERPHGRSRSEAVKTSSTFGISKDNYDVIEIERKPLDYAQARDSDAKSVIPQVDEPMRDERVRKQDFGSGSSRDESKDKYMDEDPSFRDQNSWKDDADYQVGKGRYQKSGRGGGGSQIPVSSHETGSFGRAPAQGMKGSRMGRGGRGRPAGRDNQQLGPPLPMMGSPFGPLGMAPPGPMQPLQPGISPSPGPPISPGVFMSSFSPPVVWPGARGMEMNMLGVPPAMSSVPPGSSAPRFPPNKGAAPNSGMFFNQGSGRGVSPHISGPGFGHTGPLGRGTPPDKSPGAWVPSRSSGPPGKAPSRGEQNDYSQNFVDTGMRPQNFIRELELTNVVEDYPKLRDLIQKKDEIVAKSASAPMYLKCDLKDFELSPEFLGTKFDVILIDPPWEEYVHRAPGAADHMEYWSFEEILNLKIEAIADTPSFIFLWVGDGVGLEQGRQCLKKWGFRRCEDICWVKTNKTNATPGLRHDSHTLFQHSKEHCLMGIKGTVRRSTDGHIIHANIDTDVIIAEEPPYGSTQKPEDMYRIVEHFALGRRRLELFGEDHNIRAGWLTVGKGLSSSNFNAEAYVRNFADKDGKVWQGGSGRNPPPEAPHLVLTTPEIEALRPKSPMKNQQQQSASISLTTGNSSSRRPAGNSPQNPNAFAINQEASGANLSNAGPWGASPFEVFRGNIPPENKVFDMYGVGGQASDY